MSGYLRCIVQQAAGAVPRLRPRPPSRFEDSRGDIREEVVASAMPGPAAGAAAPAPRAIEAPAAPRVRAPIRASNERIAQQEPAPLAPGIKLVPEPPVVRRMQSERREITERLLHRSERLIEQRIDIRSEHVEAAPVSHAPPRAAAPAGSHVVVPPPQAAVAPFPPTPSAWKRETVRVETNAPLFRPAAQPLPQPRRAQPSAAAPPDITISIGRLDVRVVKEGEPARRASAPGVQSQDSGVALADYLRERSGGRN